ncbi:MAG TPA: hypothetical protein VF450_01035 [Noviherbaspirillum sp.]|jgi:hypothetical protein
MNTTHQDVWTRIEGAYQQWDADGAELMAIDALPEKLPDIEVELIGETLVEAIAESRIEASEELASFRPLIGH